MGGHGYSALHHGYGHGYARYGYYGKRSAEAEPKADAMHSMVDMVMVCMDLDTELILLDMDMDMVLHMDTLLYIMVMVMVMDMDTMDKLTVGSNNVKNLNDTTLNS